MDRSQFIRLLGFSCVGASFPLLIGGCSSVHYVSTSIDKNILKIQKSEFEGIKKDQPFQRKFIMVESPALGFPIALYKESEVKYTALWTECTHQNCEVKPHDTIMACPCHGSEYNTRGKVLEGPAEHPLKTFHVTVDQSFIYVHLA